MNHVVMFSGGIGSWAAAKKVKEKHPGEPLYLVFTDVKGLNENPHIGEDQDTYRFIEDAAANVGGKLICINTGKDIWEIFKETRFLGNSRLAKCSHELKQKPARQWLETNFPDPETAIVYVGIDWTETHRIPAIIRNYLPYLAVAPLTEKPFMEKAEMIKWAKSEGLRPPRLYEMGFSHNNCGGGCVRAGQGQFKHLLDVMPERFEVWESKEIEMQEYLGKGVTILSEMVNGVRRSLPLVELRRRSDQNLTLDLDDIGGCACFVE